MNIPYISVVIATYNRHETLHKVVEDLFAQKLARYFDYEIIIVDNNSTDQTRAGVEALVPQSAGKLRYLKQVQKGKSNALNLGIQESRGEIIAFTDDDVHIDEHWLSCLTACFEKYGCDGVGGRVLPVYPPGTPSWVKENPHQMSGAVVIFDQGEETKAAGNGMPRFIGANWAFKKSVFNGAGLFNPNIGPGTSCMIGEDEEFYGRLIKNNRSLYYCAQALIWHPLDLKRLSLKSTAQWHISLGRFEAKKEYAVQKPYRNLLGVPLYIMKGIIGNFFLMPLNIFNRLRFRYQFRSFFRKLGMIYEYRDIQRSLS